VHPNEYFKRSYLLKGYGTGKAKGDGIAEEDVKMED